MARGNDGDGIIREQRVNLLHRSVSLDEEELTNSQKVVLEKEASEIRQATRKIREEKDLVKEVIKRGDYLVEVERKDTPHRSYRRERVRTSRGESIYYGAEEGMSNGDDPVVILEKSDEKGSHKIFSWHKLHPKLKTVRREDRREEFRNAKGELHSPNAALAALTIEKDNFFRPKKVAVFYNNGEEEKRVTCEISSASYMNDTEMEIFDAEGRLHSFDGEPSAVRRTGKVEWHEHGKLIRQEETDQYDTFYEKFFPYRIPLSD